MSNRSGSASIPVSRRAVLHGAAGAAAILATTVSAEADAQTGKSSVSYQDKPKGAQRCDNCAVFIAPASCKIVKGVISPSGWCMLYKAK